jgi:prepilin-type N-terminal cleavage/methylation domain-containing protein
VVLLPGVRQRRGSRHAGPGSGFTLIEILVAVAMTALIMTALGAAIGRGLEARDEARARNALSGAAQFAMQRMLASVRAGRLVLPYPDNPATAYDESVHNVLALTLDPTLDRDRDGFADANNDKDFFDANGNGIRDPGERERIDEDPGRDNSNDFLPGIGGVDDNNDGSVDDGANWMDNDEDGNKNEDPLDGSDNDGDGAVDEDIGRDANNDGCPGVCGVDDDADGQTDEGSSNDDDEDGLSNEDWVDLVVYRLNGDTLLERMPNINAANGSDYSEYPIAEGVTRFRVERLSPALGQRAVLLDITLELTDADGRTANLHTRARVGGGP